MSERRVAISSPPAVDLGKLRDPRFTIFAQTPNGPALVHFDAEQALGAIYLLEAQLWSIWAPMQFGAWAASLHERGIVVHEGLDLQRWLDACALEIAHGELN